MPAELVIKSNGTLERHWIQNPVLRIGSAAVCDVRLAGENIGAHALTIEFRNGKYFVHNRSNRTIQIDATDLRPNSSAGLKSGQLLQLDHDITIALEYASDPSPGPPPVKATNAAVLREVDTGDNGFDEADTNVPVPANPAQGAIDATAVLQLLVIGACVVGIVGMLLLKMQPPAAPTASNAYTDIKQVVDEAIVSKSQWSLHISKALQRAERARLQGDYEMSLEEFYRVRDALASAPKNKDSDFAERARGFVMNQIAKIR